MQTSLFKTLAALGFSWGALASAQAPALPELAIADSGTFPESVTATRSGAIILGNLRKPVIYRAEPGTLIARPWITLDATGTTRIMGVLADDRRNLLWACAYAPAIGDAKPVSRIETFDLKTGAPQRGYGFAGEGCNDIAIARDGTVYASDFAGGRVLRLRPGDTAFSIWVADERLASVDGLAMLADGSLLVNTFRSGNLIRISAGGGNQRPAIHPIASSRALVRPDGMRSIGTDRFAMVEGEGRLDEVIVKDDRADIRTVAEGLPVSTTAVALVGDVAVVSIADFGALRTPGADAVKASLKRIRFPTAGK